MKRCAYDGTLCGAQRLLPAQEETEKHEALGEATSGNTMPINAFCYREGTKCFGVCHGHQRVAFSFPPLNMSGRTNEASIITVLVKGAGGKKCTDNHRGTMGHGCRTIVRR